MLNTAQESEAKPQLGCGYRLCHFFFFIRRKGYGIIEAVRHLGEDISNES